MTHSHQSARLQNALRGSGEPFDEGRRSSDPICPACPPLYIADADSGVHHCARCNKVCRDDELCFYSGDVELCYPCSEALDKAIEEEEAIAEGLMKDAQPTPRNWYSFAIAFALLILGLAWFAAVANWGAR